MIERMMVYSSAGTSSMLLDTGNAVAGLSLFVKSGISLRITCADL